MRDALRVTAAMLLASVAAPAFADEVFPPVSNEMVRSECSDCHIPYQPQMLPRRSWQKLMDGLGDHFGEELSLDEAARQEVLRYLLTNAADQGGWKGEGGEREYGRREHGRTEHREREHGREEHGEREHGRKEHGEREGGGFSRGLAADDAPLRITDTPRWQRKHRELPQSVWSDPRVAFKGECEVCHTEADRGRYDDDHGLRVPGPEGTWRRWEDD